MPKRVGALTIEFDTPPAVTGFAAVAGRKEAEGPLGGAFDRTFEDTKAGQESWEKAESELLKEAVRFALDKSGCTAGEIDCIFAGDLLNQSIGTTFGLRDFEIPLIGLYGACSTIALSLGVAATFVDSGAVSKAVSATSSHFCSAERQFRLPLEYGGQRTPTAQWTATAAGAAVMSADPRGPKIRHFTTGKIVDLGVKDVNNMGAAMAPAACTALAAFFRDTGTVPGSYDMILTGDLGAVGSALLRELLRREGFELPPQYNDCGLILYDVQNQGVGAGGSGCGCSASVLCAHVLPKLARGEIGSALLCATGALMSPTASQQGESVPGIAHVVHISKD